ncbi:YlaH-like family protein [Alkalihalobacillus oceani]|uniref:YlaH-like family protein n=1 Tax=Halalkalibacter oceani TaxID=1653776 RepID=UPI00203D77E0|nr:YlaH-like family protein [Halalkalibacter oceani]MCM3759300.1 YlaH-like family protein [Halalkalibacter oceani]
MGDQQLTEQELENLTWLMRATAENPWNGLWAFLAIVALGIIVFNLGFARELPILKKVVIYIMLVIGCFVLWILEFAFGAPIIVVLIISALFLGAYRFRLHLHRKQNGQA